jgi:hypothetical protein
MEKDVRSLSHRALDQRDPVAQVVRDGEGRQVLVAFRNVGIALARKIAAVDVGPAQGVPDPAVGAVIRRDQFVLPGRGQLRERLGRGIGQGPADADERLERFPGIDEDVHLAFRGRLGRLEREGVGGRQAIRRAVGGGVDDRTVPRDLHHQKERQERHARPRSSKTATPRRPRTGPPHSAAPRCRARHQSASCRSAGRAPHRRRT